jgi:putative tributyrin esterase
MALFQVSYSSTALSRVTTFQVVIPNDVPLFMKQNNTHYERPMKTLYLLHGYFGYACDWLTGSRVQELSMLYNIAIVMPSGENSFYLNHKGTGAQYEQLIGVEIIEYTRRTFGLSNKKEDTFISGLSMGGFGAIRTGLKYPETFGKIAGLSSALIIHDIQGQKEGFDNGMADYDYYTRVFGNLNEVAISEKNPETLIKLRLEKKEEIQPIYMACGTEDFLIEQNRRFYHFLVEHNIAVDYIEASGAHDWKFWNEALEPSIQWFLND